MNAAGRVAVVDRDTEAAAPDRVHVDRVEDVLRVALADPRRVGRLPHLGECRAPELMPAEMLLDLVLRRRRHLVAGPLEDADVDHLGIRARAPDVDARLQALGLEDVARDCSRRDAQVGDMDACRREPGDERALDHPAGVRRRAACDHAVPAPERRAERGCEPHRRLGCEIDVDEPAGAVAAERRAGRARLPDDVLVDLGAGLDLLERVDADTREDARLGSHRHLIADRDALVHAHVVAEVASAPDDGALHDGAAAEVRAGIDDAPDHAGALAHGHAARQDRVSADRRTVGDPAVRADERRPDHPFDLRDVDVLADPDVAAQLEARDVELDAAVERVEIRLPELVEVADVLPVAVEHVAVDRPAHLEQEREQLLREVVGTVRRDVAQHLGLEDVDPGVDRVREHLAPRGLLEEALDAAFLVGDHDPELERVVDRLEADRDRGALGLVRFDERGQVDVAERVAGDDEKRLVEAALGELHRAGRAERLLLDRVVDVHVERLAAAEVRADRLRHEGERDDHLVHPVPAQQVEDVLHARLADDRHHRLRLVGRQRPEPCALPARHDDGLHRRTSRIALATYCAAATTANARLTQKSASGHQVSRAVTRTSASDA